MHLLKDSSSGFIDGSTRCNAMACNGLCVWDAFSSLHHWGCLICASVKGRRKWHRGTFVDILMKVCVFYVSTNIYIPSDLIFRHNFHQLPSLFSDESFPIGGNNRHLGMSVFF